MNSWNKVTQARPDPASKPLQAHLEVCRIRRDLNGLSKKSLWQMKSPVFPILTQGAAGGQICGSMELAGRYIGRDSSKEVVGGM